MKSEHNNSKNRFSFPATLTPDLDMESLAEIKQRLASEDPEVRIDALLDAWEYGTAGIELVVGALSDRDRKVRQSAQLLLSESGAEIAKQALWNYLPFSQMQCLHKIIEFNLDCYQPETHHPKNFAIANYNKTLIVYWDFDYKNSFIHTWDLATGKSNKYSHLLQHEFGLGKEGRDIVVSYQDGISVINTDTFEYCGHSRSIMYPTYQAFRVSSKSSLIATGHSNGNFTGEIEIKNYESNHYYVRSTFDGLMLCNHQNYLSSKSYNSNLCEVDFLNIPPLIFTPDDKILIAHFICFYLGRVNIRQERYRTVLQLWDVQAGKLVQTLNNFLKLTITSVGVRPDGTIIACGIREEKLCAWKLQSDKIIYTVSEMCPCILSTDGRVLIYATAKNSIIVRDLLAEKDLCVLQGHNAPIAYLALSSDREFIASYSIDRKIKIWGIPNLS